jgi:hypothetical protein
MNNISIILEKTNGKFKQQIRKYRLNTSNLSIIDRPYSCLTGKVLRDITPFSNFNELIIFTFKIQLILKAFVVEFNHDTIIRKCLNFINQVKFNILTVNFAAQN